MDEIKMGTVQTQFADLVWKHEPIGSGELVKLCAAEFKWKKSTTYTMLRRLCERGIFQNQGGVVSALLSKAEFQAVQSERFVEEHFGGSLPQFLAAFTAREKLSDAEIEELQRLIDQHRGGSSC